MEDPMLTQINSTEECERANSYPTIRLFTVNDGAYVVQLQSACGWEMLGPHITHTLPSYADNPGRAFNNGGPEHDLQNVMQPWMVASNTSLCRRENATSYVTVPPRISPEWHGGDFS